MPTALAGFICRFVDHHEHLEENREPACIRGFLYVLTCHHRLLLTPFVLQSVLAV
jgi:hypothetical protein